MLCHTHPLGCHNEAKLNTPANHIKICLYVNAMTTRSVDSEQDRDALLRLIQSREFPFTVTIVKGKGRSIWQNRLQFLWLSEITEQLGDRTIEEVRGFCKLTMGVPILRADNEAFREGYDRLIKGLPYEDKMALMVGPFDMAITRVMTVGQKQRYLDEMQRYFTQHGVILTDPSVVIDEQISSRVARQEPEHAGPSTGEAPGLGEG